MKRDGRDAKNSPYTVKTSNRYSSLEDEVSADDLREIDEANISNDSKVVAKRIKKLKKKSKRITTNKESNQSFSLESRESDIESYLSERVPTDLDKMGASMKQEHELEVNCAELEPSPLMNIDIVVGDDKLSALIDTGASSNMIKASVVERLKQNLATDSRIITGLGNKEISTLGVTMFDFSMYGVCIRGIPFHVVEDL